MELTLIVTGLAATAGLAVAIAAVLRAMAVHRRELAAAGMRGHARGRLFARSAAPGRM